MFKLRLKNYRCFIDEEFDFSRINILIGENSAGKSSILKFFLALRQSFRSPNNREYNVTFSGEDTDLGNYKEAIYNHEIDKNLSFSFEFKSDYMDFFLDFMAPIIEDEEDVTLKKRTKKRRQDVINYLGGNISKPTLINFELSNDLSKHKNITTTIHNGDLGEVKIVHLQNKDSEAEQNIYIVDKKPKCEIHFYSKIFEKTFIFTEIEFEKEAFLSIITGESLSEKIEEQFKEESEQIYLQIGFLLVAQNYVSRQIAKIEYINPLLSKPAERIYLERDRKNSKKIGDIKDLIDFLETNSAKNNFKEKLGKILSEFGIADDFHLQKEGVTKELRVMLNEVNNNITDVGFGVSLQIPIFAQALISEDTVMMNREQTDIIEGQMRAC